MANKNPPAHDFAPAWLKIPTYNNFKPPGAAGSHSSRRDEHGRDANTYHPYFGRDREDYDEYYGMDNGFNGSSCANPSIMSQRPHSRHDFRISISHAKNEGSKHMTKNGGGFYGPKGKGRSHDNCNSSNGLGVTCNNFNQEFPSLQGDISEEPTTPPALNGSAWEKPRTINIQNAAIGNKIQLIKKPAKGEVNSENSIKSPAPSSLGKIPSPGSQPPVGKGNTNCRPLLPSKTTVMKKTTKDGSLRLTNKKCPASSHSMEILVKHPKAPGTKSDFLKELRNDRKEDKDSANEDRSEEVHENGIDISKLSFSDNDKNKSSSTLSSSLEAEERLLREMGWKEEVSDDENYAPLTEDELREFRDRSLKIQKTSAPRRNLLANLSPLRLTSYPSVPAPADNSSSSESDSDDP